MEGFDGDRKSVNGCRKRIELDANDQTRNNHQNSSTHRHLLLLHDLLNSPVESDANDPTGGRA